jgi:hypothetical protein
VVKHGFAIWKELHKGKVLKFQDYDETVVNFEEFIDDWVTFGRRVDESGFWEGYVRTGPGHEIYKLKSGGDILFGASMGGIRDFECWGGAALYAAEEVICIILLVKGGSIRTRKLGY